MGATLAYYVPLVPFILFIFGGLGWLIGTIEAMVAAPLVAIGVAHPEGQNALYGKAEPAVMLIVNIFLRPSLMIIGMLAGMTLAYVSLNILNVGFVFAFGKVLDMTSQRTITGVFPPLMVMIIYTVLVVVIIQKTFTLINVIPDKVLRWLEGGAGAASAFGEETRDMEGQVAGKVQSGIGKMGEAGGQAIEGSQKLAGGAGQAAGKMMGGGGGEGGGSGGGDSGGGDDAQKKQMAMQGAKMAAGMPPV